MSLVKGQRLRPQLGLAGRFVTGFLVSATVTFSILSALGRPLSSSVSSTYRHYFLVCLLLLCLAFDYSDVRRRRTFSRLSWQRQTSRRIATDFGMGRAALAWGLDAGLGFSTYRVTAVYWLVVAFALAGLAPWWIGAVYAVAFLTPLFVGWLAALTVSGSSPTVRMSEIASAHARGARVVAFSLLCATLVAYVTSLMVV
jgi:hypothetical protein